MIQRAIQTAPAQPLARRAALALHALGETDRAWLLAQLPEDERNRLQSMLAELTALGISAARSLLHDVLQDVPHAQLATIAAESQHAVVGPSGQRTALARIEPEMAVRLLQTEPAGVIAQVLAIQNWPWRHAVLDQLGPVKRRRVEEFLGNLRLQVRSQPEALHQALIAALYGRLADPRKLAGRSGPPSDAGLGASVWRRPAWMSRLPQWLAPLAGRPT